MKKSEKVPATDWDALTHKEGKIKSIRDTIRALKGK